MQRRTPQVRPYGQREASVHNGPGKPAGVQQVTRSPTQAMHGQVVQPVATMYGWHEPPTQSEVVAQARPHWPQFDGSVTMFTHAPLHTREGAVQRSAATHDPATHSCPPVRARPTAPQFCTLVCRSTQRPPASVSPGRHSHTRDAHI